MDCDDRYLRAQPPEFSVMKGKKDKKEEEAKYDPVILEQLDQVMMNMEDRARLGERRLDQKMAALGALGREANTPQKREQARPKAAIIAREIKALNAQIVKMYGMAGSLAQLRMQVEQAVANRDMADAMKDALGALSKLKVNEDDMNDLLDDLRQHKEDQDMAMDAMIGLYGDDDAEDFDWDRDAPVRGAAPVEEVLEEEQEMEPSLV